MLDRPQDHGRRSSPAFAAGGNDTTSVRKLPDGWRLCVGWTDGESMPLTGSLRDIASWGSSSTIFSECPTCETIGGLHNLDCPTAKAEHLPTIGFDNGCEASPSALATARMWRGLTPTPKA